jgi:CDP-4-dehydro-6-deoxyglucose reductase
LTSVPSPAPARTVRLEPSGHTFTVLPGETVLAAALREGIGLPYGCRNGACGACKGVLRSGEVEYEEYQERALHPSERASGKALTCCAHPLTDLVFEVREIGHAKDLAIRTLPCRVERIEKPADDVAILFLKLPTGERLQFLAGQYIDVLLKEGKRRSFSLANAPHDDQLLQLHVRKTPGGAFSHWVFDEMKERTILRFEGPLGTFFLREDSDKPIIFVAGGTGFAPIKAIIEHAFHQGIDSPMVLYWGVRSLKDLYLAEIPARWQKEHENFSFVPVLSEPDLGDDWSGRTGFVHQAVLDDFDSLAGYQVYACGAPGMTDIARKTFVDARGLPEDEFYCDAFTPSVDPKK